MADGTRLVYYRAAAVVVKCTGLWEGGVDVSIAQQFLLQYSVRAKRCDRGRVPGVAGRRKTLQQHRSCSESDVECFKVRPAASDGRPSRAHPSPGRWVCGSIVSPGDDRQYGHRACHHPLFSPPPAPPPTPGDLPIREPDIHLAHSRSASAKCCWPSITSPSTQRAPQCVHTYMLGTFWWGLLIPDPPSPTCRRSCTHSPSRLRGETPDPRLIRARNTHRAGTLAPPVSASPVPRDAYLPSILGRITILTPGLHSRPLESSTMNNAEHPRWVG
nr:hypothetical protein CFP56_11037 [Quercus suber]